MPHRTEGGTNSAPTSSLNQTVLPVPSSTAMVCSCSPVHEHHIVGDGWPIGFPDDLDGADDPPGPESHDQISGHGGRRAVRV
jgi:hypothetical protein